MSNPLDEIRNWLSSLDQISHDHLINLATHFHTDENIYLHTGTDKGLKLFLNYFNVHDLSNREIVARALFVIALIDFSLSGKDTEEGWTEFFDRMLSMRSIGREKEMNITWIDQKLNSFQEDKEKWLAISDSWSRLKFDSLNGRNIMNWYALTGQP